MIDVLCNQQNLNEAISPPTCSLRHVAAALEEILRLLLAFTGSINEYDSTSADRGVQQQDQYCRNMKAVVLFLIHPIL